MILQLTFGTAVLIYAVVSEIIRLTIDDFAPDGFVNFGSEIWILRGIFGALLIFSLIATHFIHTDQRQLESGIPKANDVDDATIAMQLQTAQILRLAYSESIAIYGLVLYLMNAERVDLYLFCGLALSNIILTRPTRERWESAYRTAALSHPGVSSVPW